MLDGTTPERLPTPAGGEPRATPAADSHADRTQPPSMSWNTVGDPEIDIVDFQSMQSFPASDPPAWPSAFSRLAVNQENEPDSRERSLRRGATSGMVNRE